MCRLHGLTSDHTNSVCAKLAVLLTRIQIELSLFESGRRLHESMPSLSFRAKSESSLHMSMVTGFEASDWSKFSLFLHFVFVGHGVVV